jgi:hypothetical protein
MTKHDKTILFMRFSEGFAVDAKVKLTALQRAVGEDGQAKGSTLAQKNL